MLIPPRKFSSVTSFPRLHPTSREPDLPIDDATLDLWKCDQLENTDALLRPCMYSACELLTLLKSELYAN